MTYSFNSQKKLWNLDNLFIIVCSFDKRFERYHHFLSSTMSASHVWNTIIIYWKSACVGTCTIRKNRYKTMENSRRRNMTMCLKTGVECWKCGLLSFIFIFCNNNIKKVEIIYQMKSIKIDRNFFTFYQYTDLLKFSSRFHP